MNKLRPLFWTKVLSVSATAAAGCKKLQSAYVKEKEFTRIYHDLKRLAILLGMIVAVAIQPGSILLDPTLTLGKTRKKAMRSAGEPTSAFRATLLADLDGQPHLRKVVNGISFMPPLFEYLSRVICLVDSLLAWLVRFLREGNSKAIRRRPRD